jgi:hypothetical protein
MSERELEDLVSGGNCRSDGIDDPPRTMKFIVNIEYAMSSWILMSSQAMAMHPVEEASRLQEVTPDTRKGNTELLPWHHQRD